MLPHTYNIQELLKQHSHQMEENEVLSLFLFHIPKQIWEKSWTAHNY